MYLRTENLETTELILAPLWRRALLDSGLRRNDEGKLAGPFPCYFIVWWKDRHGWQLVRLRRTFKTRLSHSADTAAGWTLLDQSRRGNYALKILVGGRVSQGDTHVGFHVPVDLFEMMGAVAQDDVEQLQHRDLASVVGRDLSIE